MEHGATTLRLRAFVFGSEQLEGISKFRALFTFSGGANSAGPEGALIFDRMGNLYGATVSGGPGTSGGTV